LNAAARSPTAAIRSPGPSSAAVKAWRIESVPISVPRSRKVGASASSALFAAHQLSAAAATH
jgi:hypothetical protein